MKEKTIVFPDEQFARFLRDVPWRLSCCGLSESSRPGCSQTSMWPFRPRFSAAGMSVEFQKAKRFREKRLHTALTRTLETRSLVCRGYTEPSSTLLSFSSVGAASGAGGVPPTVDAATNNSSPLTSRASSRVLRRAHSLCVTTLRR